MTKGKSSLEIIYAGHRGMGANELKKQLPEEERTPENSMASFKRALRNGVDSIEFDLLRSSDQVLVVNHDNDLAITSKLKNPMSPNNPKKILDKKIFGEKSYPFYIHKTKSDLIQQAFDISHVQNQDGTIFQTGTHVTKDVLDKGDLHITPIREEYSKIPIFSNVLALVSKENSERTKENKPNIKLNIELKTNGTGNLVKDEIERFNDAACISDSTEIASKDTYYLSFSEAELLAVAKDQPEANLILAVPTEDTYKKVSNDFKIEDSTLNKDRLDEKVLGFSERLKQIPNRNRGLDGVDMVVWDVGDDVLNYYGKHKIPVSLAITPLGKDHLEHAKLLPVIDNIDKIAEIQKQFYTSEDKPVMFVKTDSPVELKKIVAQNKEKTTHETIVSAKKHLVNSSRKRKKKQKVPLYHKPWHNPDPRSR
jgi:glycerophosphoryl diester phosphodiesterase